MTEKSQIALLPHIIYKLHHLAPKQVKDKMLQKYKANHIMIATIFKFFENIHIHLVTIEDVVLHVLVKHIN